jgi:transposase
MVRYRQKLVQFRTSCKQQIHAVLAKEGVSVPMSDLFGAEGMDLLDGCKLGVAYRLRVDSLLELIAIINTEIASAEEEVAHYLAGDKGYLAIQEIGGVGPVLAGIFVAEIGDVTRFPSPDRLASWAGLTPRHHESDTSVHRGPITKQGSRLVRWAAVEAAQRQRAGTRLRSDFLRIAATHGNAVGARKIARVAVARKIVHLVYYGLRDGTIRCLAVEAA